MLSTTCWNCGSRNFVETAKLEKCPDCGIECDYNTGKSNDAYNRAMEAKWARERAQEEREYMDAKSRWEEEAEADENAMYGD